jgi:hypothetical protein
MSKLETNTIDTVSGSTTLTLGGTNATTIVQDSATTVTGFKSTGIDDNATTNALTIDSSSNLKFNSGFGSVATAYGVRVWLRYDQVNNVVEGSGNVSSVSDNSTGNYTINFTNSMSGADYALGAWSGRNANPTVTGSSNNHNVDNIIINTGDAINNVWTLADVDDSTVIIVK